ncbi:centrosomal protein of 44 kDa isoform X3 [Prionailurus bengalensis]|uniref:centrosomal protein of 44 kDa isoform X3 n=1 Tax=Prionailurus bengalensis TaxID=37029 RepID=UPI001CA9D626|nr:centrosomal protein of 44 kDa isoform X3 [Prionailurus bengalensis]XP_043421396.1 centrosomal protein of 44 kDa isoform X3 [Prionailurus bengalensis]
MATGDLKRSLRNLEQVLRSLNYPKEVDCVGLVKGDTTASLPIISYSLTSYSPYVAELLMESNIELIAKNDLRFIDTVYKLLRDQFNYKPVLTKKQFLQCGFAEWKIQIVCDILNCVMKKHKELSSFEKIPSQQRKKISSVKSEPSSSTEKTSTESVGIDITGRFMTSGKTKAVVIRHLYNEDGVNIPEDTRSTVTDVSGAFDVCDLKTTEIKVPEVKFPEIKSEQQNDEYINFGQVNEDYESSNDLDILNSDRKGKEERQTSVPLSSGYSTVSSDSIPRTPMVCYCGLKENSEETTIQKMERMKKMFEETAELLKCPNH